VGLGHQEPPTGVPPTASRTRRQRSDLPTHGYSLTPSGGGSARSNRAGGTTHTTAQNSPSSGNAVFDISPPIRLDPAKGDRIRFSVLNTC
jgi:hypothetical protein